MIISGFITICTSIIQFLFSWVNLPDIPLSAQSTFDTYMSYIFYNLNFLNFFLNVDTLKTVSSIALVLFAFEHIYKIMIWIIHKIPLSIN